MNMPTDLPVNFIAITERRRAVITISSTALGINATNAFRNDSIAANLAEWIVTLFPTQGDDGASVAEVLLFVVTSTYTACALAAANFGYYALSATKATPRIITIHATFLINLATETELGPGVVCPVGATSCVVTIVTARGYCIVTTERRLGIVHFSSTLLVNFVGIAEVVA